MRTELKSKFVFGDCVHIDRDPSLIARVVGFSWKADEHPTVEVSWMHNGSLNTAWLNEWRLTKVGELSNGPQAR